MVKLTHLSAIRLRGADAGDFLHNQLSSDVLGLASGDSVFACYCEPKGRVLAWFYNPIWTNPLPISNPWSGSRHGEG